VLVARYDATSEGLVMVLSTRLLFSLLSCALLLGASAPRGVRSRPETSGSIRVAEGEYEIYTTAPGDGIGPFAPGVFNFRESWTLWRIPDHTLQVEGERSYESPMGEPHQNKFSVHLAADFHILRVMDFRPLRWQPDSGPLTCDFLPQELSCSSGAKNPDDEIRLNISSNGAVGLLWPISAFSLSHITRSVDHRAGHTEPVRMITVEEANAENPAVTTILDGSVRYLSEEQIVVAQRKWDASKFELRIALHPPFLIWTSKQGLLLDFSEQNNRGRPTETGMSLTRFQQFASF
jgi:hypothetical protein